MHKELVIVSLVVVASLARPEGRPPLQGLVQVPGESLLHSPREISCLEPDCHSRLSPLSLTRQKRYNNWWHKESSSGSEEDYDSDYFHSGEDKYDTKTTKDAHLPTMKPITKQKPSPTPKWKGIQFPNPHEEYEAHDHSYEHYDLPGHKNKPSPKPSIEFADKPDKTHGRENSHEHKKDKHIPEIDHGYYGHSHNHYGHDYHYNIKPNPKNEDHDHDYNHNDKHGYHHGHAIKKSTSEQSTVEPKPDISVNTKDGQPEMNSKCNDENKPSYRPCPKSSSEQEPFDHHGHDQRPDPRIQPAPNTGKKPIPKHNQKTYQVHEYTDELVK